MPDIKGAQFAQKVFGCIDKIKDSRKPYMVCISEENVQNIDKYRSQCIAADVDKFITKPI